MINRNRQQDIGNAREADAYGFLTDASPAREQKLMIKEEEIMLFNMADRLLTGVIDTLKYRSAYTLETEANGCHPAHVSESGDESGRNSAEQAGKNVKRNSH